MNVVLMGYMGSGKSTVGEKLASILNYDFLDLDDYISKKEKLEISDLFKKKGEIYFRKKEAEYLKEIVDSREDIVLALGGGTPCYGNNLPLLLSDENTKTFYLKLSILNLIERLKNEKSKRPLISHIYNEVELQEYIGKHLFERSTYYNKANYTINSDNKSQKDVLEDILMHLI